MSRREELRRRILKYILLRGKATRPELVEYRAVTKDEERPVRAFSYMRGGRGGIVYWAVGAKVPPELTLAAPGLSVKSDGARRFVEADVAEADLLTRFRAALTAVGN